MDICSEFKNIVKTEFIGGELNYYVKFGTMKDMICQMTHIVGKPLLPPKWALGYHQSIIATVHKRNWKNYMTNFKN
jgi:Alpha-glucosidases, family 31 of glycosyl hydrolases